jgi:CTP:phosphocholine cytidylyltransferase-like protein/thiamine kinase-like enzyme
MLTKNEFLLLKTLLDSGGEGQREISRKTGLSLGTVNTTLNALANRKYLDNYRVTDLGIKALEPYKVDNAIILAAGLGSRFVPFTYDTPKGLLKVKGTPMIERQIAQLREKGIDEIIVVVGYLKEKFDYLIDKYGVKLVYNPEFYDKNNLASVYYAQDYLKSSYVLVSDNWIEKNIFNRYEPDSWMAGVYFEGPSIEWGVTTTARGRIKKVEIGCEDSWALLGPTYFTREFSSVFVRLLREYYSRPETANYYFEHIIKENLNILPIYFNRQSSDVLFEFESFEELRRYDNSYRQDTDNRILREIAKTFGVSQSSITDIRPLKEGLTNESFVFSIDTMGRYVFRVPRAKAGELIDRAAEKRIYELLAPYDVTDKVISFDADTGHRITGFYDNVRIADAGDDEDLALSMREIRRIHDLELTVDHPFDIAGKIDYCQKLCEGVNAIRFEDFWDTRADVTTLLEFRERLNIPELLCHGEYLHANVLVFSDGTRRLIDWEYSGMSDPIMDVAMYGIFSHFSKERLDLSLRLYLGQEPTRQQQARLYLYAALVGFLWSLWAEYKQALGQEFGEFPMIMYRYMKDYSRLLDQGGYLDE